MRDTGTQGHPGRLRHELMIAKKRSVRGTQRKFTNRDCLLKRVAWQIDKVSPIRKQVRPALGLKTTEKKKTRTQSRDRNFGVPRWQGSYFFQFPAVWKPLTQLRTPSVNGAL